jgi:hypothetical protein
MEWRCGVDNMWRPTASWPRTKKERSICIRPILRLWSSNRSHHSRYYPSRRHTSYLVHTLTDTVSPAFSLRFFHPGLCLLTSLDKKVRILHCK